MKYIKYLIAVLLLGATLASCAPSEGTVGQTTVQFKMTEVKEGFGAGTIYVPISIFGANFDAMNTAPVNVKVKLDPTYTGSEEGVVVATEDLTGKPDENGKMGDIRITSCDMVFSGNYNVEDEDKKKPVTKDIAVEIMILNTEPEIMEFKLVLESSNTAIGAVKECVVRLEKGPADRLCGEWWTNFAGTVDLLGGSPDITSSFKTEMYYDQEAGWLYFFEPIVEVPMVFNFNKDTNELTYPTFEVLMAYDADAGQYICQWVFTIKEDMFYLPEEDEFACEYDAVNYTYIKIPKLEEYATIPTVLQLDENFNLQSILGWFHNEALVGLNLTRVKPAGKAPAMAPSADYAQPELTYYEATAEQSEALKAEFFKKYGTLKVK